MSFVSTSAATSFRALALLRALIGNNRLRDSNRGCQSNRRESSYCQCLKPSFVHYCFIHSYVFVSSFRGSFLSTKTPVERKRLQRRVHAKAQRSQRRRRVKW